MKNRNVKNLDLLYTDVGDKLQRTTLRRPLAALKTCSKGSVHDTRLPSSAISFDGHSKRLWSHSILMTRRARPKSMKATLTKVLIDGGSGPNVLFTKTLKKMKLDITSMLTRSTLPFYGIVLNNVAIPLGSVVLLVTFGTREKYCTEYIKFEVADFETSYHAILGRLALAKFMAIPHYMYLVLKMRSPARVLMLQGDLKRSYDCDTKAVELAATTQVPNAMIEIFIASKKLALTELEIPEKNDTTKKPPLIEEVQLKAVDLRTGDSSKSTMIGAGLDPK
jgi:hypothetical protein